MKHYYHDDYLRIATGFPLDCAASAETVRDDYIPAMEEQARRCENAADLLRRDDLPTTSPLSERLEGAEKWSAAAERIRKHIAVARERLRKAGSGEGVA